MDHAAATHGAAGNTLFYLAVAPDFFATVNRLLDEAGFTRMPGARRIIVEKPFGKDLDSALALNRDLLARWREEEIHRIDHYLGKETVQNLLAFRLANAMFEPLWNAALIDHVQISAAETVGVETRGDYYDATGVVRDMIQNHLMQMLAYVCMEPPASLEPDAVREAKSRLLETVRIPSTDDVARDCVRGQYNAGRSADGSAAAAYRAEPRVAPADFPDDPAGTWGPRAAHDLLRRSDFFAGAARRRRLLRRDRGLARRAAERDGAGDHGGRSARAPPGRLPADHPRFPAGRGGVPTDRPARLEGGPAT